MTPSTTVPAAGSVHDFGVATLIALGFVIVVAGMIVGRRRPTSRLHPVRRGPGRPWRRPDGTVDRVLYMRSETWALRRRKVAIGGGWWGRYRCRWPGCKERTALQAHHLTYRNLGNEQPGELVWLCAPHHSQVPTRPHPPLEAQQQFFRVGPWAQRKVAA